MNITKIHSEIGDLLDTYNSVDAAELEFRIKISNPLIFEILFNKFAEDNHCTHEQTITSITDRAGKSAMMSNTDRTVIYYKKGRYVSEEFSKKSKLGSVNFISKHLGSYQLTLSTEEDIDEFSNNAAKLVIFKCRTSFVIGDWRYDFNVFKEFSSSHISGANTYKKAFLRKMNENKFIRLLDLENIKLSLEVEHCPDESSDDSDQLNIEGVMDVVNNIMLIVDPDHINNMKLQEAVYAVAPYIRPKMVGEYRLKYGLKRLLPQVKTLTKSIFLNNILPNIEEYHITPKADGERCLALITNTSCQIITTRFTRTVNVSSEDEGISVIDCEMLGDIEDPLLIPIDTPYINNKNLRNEGFEVRLEEFDNARDMLSIYAGPTKQFKHLKKKNYGRVIQKLMDHKWKFEIDGIIFARGGQNYTETETYKWKPEPTIDFLVRRVPKTLQGKAPYQIKKGYTPYILFCGISHRYFHELKLSFIDGYEELFPRNFRRSVYFPIQFSPPDFPRAFLYYHDEKENLDSKVVEFTYVIPEGSSVIGGHWKVKRIREDRTIELQHGNYFGNDFYIAKTNWSNLSDPITVDFMINPTRDVYFKEVKSNKYIGLTKLTHYIKRTLIRLLRDSKWVIDLGSGKGQDLFNYTGNGISKILFIDKDADALHELGERMANPQFKDKIKYKVLTHNIDINQSYIKTTKELIEFNVPSSGVNNIVCNMAAHYMVDTKENMDNFIKLINKTLKSGGRVILTLLDGLKVHNLFERKSIAKGGSIDIFEDNDKKYSIKRLYKAKNLYNHKHNVSVLLPFSKGEYYTETLVNIEYLITQFEKKGFERELYSNFMKKITQFKKHQMKFAHLLTQEDIAFASLYSMVVLYKPE